MNNVLYKTHYCEFCAKEIDGEKDPYYYLTSSDYVSIFAMTPDGRIPLVKQYRPVVDKYVLELPSGHVEDGEDPELAACRELEEETSLIAKDIQLLGAIHPDVGRIQNKQWCYFIKTKKGQVSSPEAHLGIEAFLCDQKEISRLIIEEDFGHALGLSTLFLAQVMGIINFSPSGKSMKNR